MTAGVGVVSATECIDNFQHVLYRADVTETQAVEFCRSLGATLGPIRDEEEFLEVAAMITATGISGFRGHMGLIVGAGLTRASGDDTSVFRFAGSANQTGIEFYNGPAGQFPWGVGEPTNIAEDCGELFFDGNSGEIRVNDLPCGALRSFLVCRETCETSVVITPIKIARNLLETETNLKSRVDNSPMISLILFGTLVAVIVGFLKR